MMAVLPESAFVGARALVRETTIERLIIHPEDGRGGSEGLGK